MYVLKCYDYNDQFNNNIIILIITQHKFLQNNICIQAYIKQPIQ
jgi:hypothetical protein